MNFYDDLETRNPEQRERDQLAALSAQVAHAKSRAPYFAALLRDVDPQDVRDRMSLAKLPVTRKSDLIALQKQAPPFAGMTAVPNGALGRIFSSPGPIYDPQGPRGDFWRMGRALFAAGFRRGDVVHNTFSYHFTPAGFINELKTGELVHVPLTEPDLSLSEIGVLIHRDRQSAPAVRALSASLIEEFADLEKDIKAWTASC